jgi:pimeloyl-ACP methyl ester carboxylesterase
MALELEHTRILTNGVNLHVIVAGPPEGRPVILLHGFPEFWRGWIKQIEPLARAGYRVIVPDQRGYNLSDKPRAVGAYRLEELVADIVGLMDHFGYAKVALAGHDWGAAVAWSVALAYPGRVDRLAILNVPHPAVMLKFLASSPRQMLKSWYIGFFQIPGLADWLLGANNCARLTQLMLHSGRAGSFTPQDLAEYQKAWSRPGAVTAMINWYRALLRYRAPAAAEARVRVPTLVLWGKRDAALSAEMAPPSVALCDDGRLIFFESATHWVQHDEAEAVSRHLLEFFGPG